MSTTRQAWSPIHAQVLDRKRSTYILIAVQIEFSRLIMIMPILHSPFVIERWIHRSLIERYRTSLILPHAVSENNDGLDKFLKFSKTKLQNVPTRKLLHCTTTLLDLHNTINLGKVMLGLYNYTEDLDERTSTSKVKRGTYNPPRTWSKGPQHLSPLLWPERRFYKELAMAW